VSDECRELLLLQLQAHQIVALAANELVVLAQLGAEPSHFQRGLDAHDQLRGTDRLGEKVIGPYVQRVVERLHVTLGRQEQHRVSCPPGKARIALHTAKPFMPGILTSSKTQSGGSALNARKPSSPLVASATR
jgi:hypothetical protein